MVSKSLLMEYYDIPLDKFGFFHYQGQDYYFSKNKDLRLYWQYIQMTQFVSYRIVKNVFHQDISQECILYRYQNNNIDIDRMIFHSLYPVQKKPVSIIKKSWIKLMNDIQDMSKNDMVYYYNFALGQLAIELLNYYLSEDTKIQLGIEHILPYPDIKNICNPDNIVLATRINDLGYLYSHDFITDVQLKEIIENYQLEKNDLIMLLCRNVYPNTFFINVFHRCIDLHEEKKQLKNNLQHIRNLISVLDQYITVPAIYWI